MITLKTLAKFPGPSLLEMRSLLPLSNEPLTVAWNNTKAEVQLIRRYPGRTFVLVVPDVNAMERAATTLGLRYALDPAMINTCAKAIDSTGGGKWRSFANDTGPTVSRGVMLQMIADAIRKGNDPKPLRKLMVECMLDNTPTMEADVLLGLRFAGARK